MRTARPRRLEQVVPFAAAADPADLIETFSKSSAWSFMVIVCDFNVTWICGTPVQFTSVIVPTIEYTLDDSAKSGGAGAEGGCVFGVADTVAVVAGFASGYVFCFMLRAESDSRAVWSPAVLTAARSLPES
jgi:hypothetical protein